MNKCIMRLKSYCIIVSLPTGKSGTLRTWDDFHSASLLEYDRMCSKNVKEQVYFKEYHNASRELRTQHWFEGFIALQGGYLGLQKLE